MKSLGLALAAAATFLGTTLATAEAGATNYTLWIHGRNTGTPTQIGNYADFSYWGPASAAAGVNKKAVNWNGVGYISQSNGAVRTALDRFCTGTNWCYVAVHSAGGAQLGYAQSWYGTSTRNVVNPDTGVATGQTQIGWNIRWTAAMGSAEGGTELADMGYWAVSDYLTNDLRTGTVRPMFNHNSTGGTNTYMFAGASGTLYSGVLSGQDDEVIAYHSALGFAQTGSYCNWSDWFCDQYLKLDANGNMVYYNGNIKSRWSYHPARIVDQGESYNHYSNGNWGGIIGPTRSWVASYAL